jgi:hypothetical protein
VTGCWSLFINDEDPQTVSKSYYIPPYESCVFSISNNQTYDPNISSEKTIKLASVSPNWKGQTMYTFNSNSTDHNYIKNNYYKFPQTEYTEGEIPAHGKNI